MKRWILLLLPVLLLPILASAQNNGVSIRYGFSFLSPYAETGTVEEDRSYNFLHFTYFHQWPLFRNGYLVLEPFLAYINKPESGWDVGGSLLFRYYVKTSERTSLFSNLGIGFAYTSVQFIEQTHQYLFSPSLGIGFKWGIFLLKIDSAIIPTLIWNPPIDRSMPLLL